VLDKSVTEAALPGGKGIGPGDVASLLPDSVDK